MRFKRDPGPTEARGNDAAVERSSEAERSLLERARRLDMRAHAEIFDAHYPAIFRYLRLRLPDAELAEDLGAEVFTRLLEAMRDGRGPRESLRGWLYGVAANCVADHHRRQGLAQRSEHAVPAPSAAPDPARQAEGRLRDETLDQALRQLSEEQQHVIALRFGSEMRIREVAEAMGKSEGAVKQLQARAVARLANLVGDLGGSGA
ncbi:MAG: sigma-70 family RNA polymerase sigma factor [Chloroflexi bacterium]|nr:sigma-70 family RNA polymerase sigma factor [Chloroflexota bacterium]